VYVHNLMLPATVTTGILLHKMQRIARNGSAALGGCYTTWYVYWIVYDANGIYTPVNFRVEISVFWDVMLHRGLNRSQGFVFKLSQKIHFSWTAW